MKAMPEAALPGDGLNGNAHWLGHAVEHTAAAIYIKDAAGLYRYLNRGWESIIRSPRSEMLGRDDVAIFGDLASRSRHGLDLQVIAGGVSHESEEAFGEFVLLSRRTPLIEDGKVIGLCNVTADITERRKVEQALRQARDLAETATRMKSNFLANMSHELRTPLNAILGFTGTLLMGLPGPLNDEQQRQLSTIRGSANHLLALINDLLDLARIEAGRMELKPERIDCQQLLEAVAENLRPLAGRKNLRLDVELPLHSVQVTSDARVLKQVVLNLAYNAVKFTERGSVTISLRTIAREGASFHEIAVADTGIGIRAEDRQRLFQAFSQVDTVCDGTGLGLHLSQRFSQLIGGCIEFESQYGKGSRFALLLPGG